MFFFHLENNRKLVLKNYGKLLKYVFQTQYNFEKLEN
jgi:hypothetical protein